jgi:hypothetical protein
MPFADFTRQRLFQPLGMTRTSWRDDHTRIVKQRAIAYDDRKDGFHTDMPFEDVHGNGGLLTTVGDLLTWNEHFDTPRAGDASLVALQQQAGSFNDGRTHGYAFGLMLGSRKGVRVVEHSGSTAGYSAHLLRYPGQHISVAVLCNVNTAPATEAAREVADLYLGDRAGAPAAAQVREVPRELPRNDGFMYRHTGTGVVLTEARAGATVIPGISGSTWSADGDGRIRVTDPYGTVETYERVPAVKPLGPELNELAGTYASDEAETTLVARVEEGSLVLKRRPGSTIKLTPVYRDAFNAPGLGFVIFRRDGSGRVTALSVNQDRVWDLRFTRSGS